MLLTIATTHNPATDLGYLLYKNPANVQTFELNFGKATVFYPEATAERCEVALLLDVDPVGLVRRDRGSDNMPLQQYVNDRPYVASSFMSVAIAQVFRTAMSGRCEGRPELAELAIPLEVKIPTLPCRESEQFLRGLFEPLGYEVEALSHAADEVFSDWGMSPYYSLTLKGTKRLSEMLSHIYVLIPVLDHTKHYYNDRNELEKLLRHGEGWLAAHPLKEKITSRFLTYRKSLVAEAMDRLAEDGADAAQVEERQEKEEEALEKKISLNETRMKTVLEVVKKLDAHSVVDMGCGEGKLLQSLLTVSSLQKILGVDVSYRCLEAAKARLKIDSMHDRQKERLQLAQGSLTYCDKRLQGFDLATCIEVVEHLDSFRLEAFAEVIFGNARPRAVILTTPNSEYNVKFAGLPPGAMRHRDHRFEWNRTEFQTWALGVAQRYGYKVEYQPVGEDDPVVGPPTQMAVFTK